MSSAAQTSAEPTPDVMVMGSGAAGLSAALTAAVGGARVWVVEKANQLGGSTAWSGGCVWVPCHHRQAGLGIEDSPQLALQYIEAATGEDWDRTPQTVWQAYVDQSPRMLEFLEANSPLRFKTNREPDPYAELPGGLPWGRNVSPLPIRTAPLGDWAARIRQPVADSRMTYDEIVDHHVFANPRRRRRRFLPAVYWRRWRGRPVRGHALVVGLLRGCLERGVRILPDTAVVELQHDVQAGVRGAVLERDGRRETVPTRTVVLASGGFEWDADRMARHFPGPVEWLGTPPENAGDGQRLAEKAGAHLDRMDQALIMGTTPFQHAGHTLGAPTGDYSLPHCIIVNRLGRRFVNEKQMNIGLAFAERDSVSGLPVNLPAWRLYDAQFAARYPHALPARGGAEGLVEAPSLAALAERIGVDPSALEAAVQRFNAGARRGEDPEFGRGASLWDQSRGGDPDHPNHYTLGTLAKPPFYAAPFKASILGTKGGPRTDEHARVLNRNGAPIPGLLAAGNVMANPIGSRGVGAGTTLGPCLTWGYIAGQTAAMASPGSLSP